MAFQISPGVNWTEIDQSTIVPSVPTTNGGFVGVFQWGPLDKIVLVGSELNLVSNFGKPNEEVASSFYAASNFLAYSNSLQVVRVASEAFADVSFTVSTIGTAMTGVGFINGTIPLREGCTITHNSDIRIVVSITSDTAAVLNSAFPSDLVSANVDAHIYVGALNATAEDGTGSGNPGIGALIKNEDDYNANYSNGSANVGLWAARCAGKLGNSLEVSICPSANAFNQTLVGTVSSSSNVLTGIGTSFLSRVTRGSIIIDSVSGQQRKVIGVSSDTQLSVDSAFSPALSGATVVARWEFADAIGIAPGTSSYAVSRGGLNDELHVVVVDSNGLWSGIQGTVLERHSFLSKGSDAKAEDGSNIYYPSNINGESSYVWWTDHLPAGLNWGSAVSGVTFTAINQPIRSELSGGRDVNTGADIDGAKLNGWDLFANADSVDVELLITGDASATVASYVIDNICEERLDCVAFISPPMSAVVNNNGNEVDDSISFRNSLPSTSYAVMDSGWKLQYDKYNDTNRWVPLNGDIAGLCARTDQVSDPWFSPAGINRGNIKNVIKLAYSPYKAQRDMLYLSSINPVINLPGQGTVLYGDKTLLGKPSAFDRINVRRLFIVLEKSISRASQSSLFELNDTFTRANFRGLVEPFLQNVQSRRGIYAFKVVCDTTNNTPDVIDANEFVGDIYIQPAKSINFIQLNFIATRTGVDFSESVGSA